MPDYVANASGIINVAAEYLGESGLDVEERVLEIGPCVRDILEEARLSGRSPATIADEIAEAKVSTGRRLAA